MKRVLLVLLLIGLALLEYFHRFSAHLSSLPSAEDAPRAAPGALPRQPDHGH